ncbi:glycosyltransferase family 4 protein [Sphingobacterium sp. SGR-19]|uniref:glycosyltransferase family 4 protein n=1 Tax=Sphingobacterium sp. SGR-19 TaxID=2710886 RepID=UPI0013EAC43C|nr:glycosyltransferase family 4 protein [Sphingobacterium sp. SGR-19]NGM64778.1 glycosyltransferase family 4 protein [Sphingobacterium sp. SGR-19]
MREKPKKVLVAVNDLVRVGGAEMYTFDLIKAFAASKKIEVEYFTVNKGLVSEKIEAELQVPFMSQKKYDLIFATHNTTVKELFGRGPIIQICHGTILEPEQPSPLADYHVAISQEIADHLTDLGYANEVVLNGIDIKVKKPIKPIHKTLTSVLSLCQSEKANKMLRTVCDRKGLRFEAYNKHKNPTNNIEQEINNFDMVVGIGRSIYDAMACGRPSLIYDNRGYNGNKADGYLRPENFSKYVKKNCSGRYLNREYHERELIRELEKYNPEDGEKLRNIAMSHLNAYKMADQLLNTANQLNWRNRLNKWRRFATHTKLVKHAFLYKKIYALTKNEYFNRSSVSK